MLLASWPAMRLEWMVSRECPLSKARKEAFEAGDAAAAAAAGLGSAGLGWAGGR